MKVITTKVNNTIGLLQTLQKTLLRLVLITIYKAFVRSHLDYGLLQKFQKTLLRLVSITMYKAFVRLHLDYGDMIYDEAYNETFHHKLESVQCNTCLALSGAIRGSSREKLYHELGLESLQH